MQESGGRNLYNLAIRGKGSFRPGMNPSKKSPKKLIDKPSMAQRTRNIRALGEQEFDVLIVGGGINGAVAAASLAARGAATALVEKSDFASETSSQSSNLVWGGIKYLESFEIPLVYRLCKSRDQLTEMYPSTVKEIRFLTAVRKNFRWPAAVVFLGAVFYWVLGGFRTQRPRYLSRKKIRAIEPALNVDDATAGFEYSDCYLHDNDARFVFNFVRSALNRGAVAANYVAAQSYERTEHGWSVGIRDELTGEQSTVRAKVLINACGPYADEQNLKSNVTTEHRHLFSKGVHLVVDRVTPHRRILTFFASDGRPFFVIPMGNKTCVGTTDTQVSDADAGVTEEDRRFILDNVNAGLALDKPLELSDIIAERCGVRPLAVTGGEDSDDWLQLSRKHAIDVDEPQSHISVFGGKLTDCLNVGDEIAEVVESLGIPLQTPKELWYGEPSPAVKARFVARAEAIGLDAMTAPGVEEMLSERLWRRYGDAAFGLLEQIESDRSQADILISNAEYIRCELEYAAEHEMITKLDDFMRRRSKISLVMSTSDIANATGLRTACEMLFGDEADAKLAQYFAEQATESPGERVA